MNKSEKLIAANEVEVSIDGVSYRSSKSASTKLKVSPSTVSRRLKSNDWPTWKQIGTSSRTYD